MSMEKDYRKKLGVHFGGSDAADDNGLFERIQHWYFSLPKYAKIADSLYRGTGRYADLDTDSRRLRQLLKNPDMESGRFLHEELPEAFQESDLSRLCDLVGAAKRRIDSICPALESALLCDVCDVFQVAEVSRVWDGLSRWYASLPERTRRHIFDNGETRLLRAAAASTMDISRFAFTLMGSHPEHFEADSPTLFYHRLKQYKSAIERFDSVRQGDIKNMYAIRLGNREIQTFQKTGISGTGGLLFSELNAILAEYGQAVRNSEKRQVLLDVLAGIDGPEDMGRGHDILG